jgi:phospholipid/cholesterol/gamma-HCH transport system substrate-binding protein
MAFVAYPEVGGAATSVLPGDGTAHLGLALNLFNPPPCTNGYQGTPHRAGNDLTPAPKLNLNAYCDEPSNSPIDVRGAQNAPFGGSPGSPAPGSSAGSTQPTAGGSGADSGSSGSGLPGSTDPGVTVTSLAQLLGVG